MRSFHELISGIKDMSARIDVLCAQQEQMSAMRRQSSRLHNLLHCAPTAQALATDLVQVLGSSAGALHYLHEMRAECVDVFDALTDEIGRMPPNHEGHHD